MRAGRGPSRAAPLHSRAEPRPMLPHAPTEPSTPPAQRDGTDSPTGPERSAPVGPLYQRDEIARILAEREAWTGDELAEALARLPRRRERFETDSGIPIPDL